METHTADIYKLVDKMTSFFGFPSTCIIYSFIHFFSRCIYFILSLLSAILVHGVSKVVKTSDIYYSFNFDFASNI